MKRNYIYFSVFSVFIILISACEADTSTSSGGGDDVILSSATAPLEVSGVTGTATDRSIILKWQAPTLTSSHKKADGQALTKADVSYKIYRVAKGGSNRTVAEIKAADKNPIAVAKGTTSTTITNLTSATTYEIVVQAVNSTDTTKVSAGTKVEVTTLSTNQATSPPDARSVTGSSTDISARITWQEPTLTTSHKKADGQALTKADVSYKVYRVAKGAGTRTVAQIKEADTTPLAVAEGTTSINITNLNKSTTYEVVVQAVNSTDTTKVSTGVKIEVTTLATNQATAPPDARSVTAGSPTDTSVGISWTAPDLTSSHKKADGQILTAADVYYKVYRVVKGSNARDVAEIKEADTTPLEVAKGTTSTTINNLSGSTTYEVVVQAVNSTDPTKVATGIRIEVTTTNPATAPAEARSVTGSPTDTSVGISWQAPDLTSSHKKADGQRLTIADVSYKVYRVAKGSDARDVAEIKKADATPLTVVKGTTSVNITNLNKNTTYEVVVQAVNSTDTTKVSTGVKIEVTTLATNLATAPADARSVTAGSPTDTSVVISWQAPDLTSSHKKADGQRLTIADVSYKVYRVAKGSDARDVAEIIAADKNPLAVAKGTTSINITNLTHTTTYEIVVQAVNSTDPTKVSTGVKIEVTTLTTNQATAPPDAHSVTGSPTDTSVGISWTAPDLTSSHKKVDGQSLTAADVSYKVYRVTKGAESRTIAEIKTADTTPITVAKGTTSTTITSLTPNTTYEIVVQAINFTDSTKASTGIRIEVTTDSLATAPADASSVTGSPTDTSVGISWQAPNLSTSHKKADGQRLTTADVSYKVYRVAKGADTRTIAEIKTADKNPLVVAKGTTNTTITSLAPSTTYEVVVQAVNSTDTTKVSTGVKIEVTTLANNQATAPADVRSVIGSPTDTSVGISWQEPTLNNSHKKADGQSLTAADVSYKVYRLEKGAESRTIAQIIAADNKPLAVAKGTTRVNITNLTTATTYEVVVQAVNSTDPTKVSTGVREEVTTTNPATAPAEASSVAGSSADTSARITWQAPNLSASHKKKDGTQLTQADVSYKVYRVAKGSNARPVAEIKAADTNPLAVAKGITSINITNLTRSTTYEIAVQAVNSTDPTKVSTGIRIEVTTINSATVPLEARSVAAGLNDDGSATISWQAPMFTSSHKKADGTQLTKADVSYKVYRVERGVRQRPIAQIIAEDKNPLVVAKGTTSVNTNLKSNIYYEIVVQVINATDTTKVSPGEITIVFVANHATAPPNVTSIQRQITDNSISLYLETLPRDSHKKRNGKRLAIADISYKVYRVVKGADARDVAQIKAADGNPLEVAKGTTSVNITNLNKNTTYEIVVQTVNSTDPTKVSTGVKRELTTLAGNQATAPPDARSVTAGSPTNTSVAVSWQAPALTSSHKKTDGQALTKADVSYKVYQVIKGNNARTIAEIKAADTTPLEVAKGTTSINIANLTPGTTYEVVVQAVNATDFTKVSTGIREEVTTLSVATEPADARSVTAGSPTDTSVGISWQAPALTSIHKKADGTQLTQADVSYKVYRVAKGAKSRTVASIIKADAKPITVARGTTRTSITNLTPGTTYEVVVQTINATDTTKISTGIREEVTTLSVATEPADIRNISLAVITDKTVYVSWQAPALTNIHKKADGTQLTQADVSYKVYRVAKGAKSRTVASIIKADTKPITVARGTTNANITNLTFNTTYEIVVQTVNATDTTKVSTGIRREVLINPATTPPEVNNIVNESTDTTLELSWSIPFTSNHKKTDGNNLTSEDVSHYVFWVEKGKDARTIPQIKAIGKLLMLPKGNLQLAYSLSIKPNTTYEIVIQVINATDPTKISTGIRAEITTLRSLNFVYKKDGDIRKVVAISTSSPANLVAEISPNVKGTFFISPNLNVLTGVSFNTSDGTISGKPTKSLTTPFSTRDFTIYFTAADGRLVRTTLKLKVTYP